MGKEFELKYGADARILEVLAGDFPQGTPITMETAYYDDPCRTLAVLRWTLRRRLENGISLCTLKTPGEDGVSGEWETECDCIAQAIPKLCALGAPEKLRTLGPLTQVCGARFVRWATLLELPDCTAELALDRGVLLGGGRELPLFEIELELKDGARAALERWGEAFSEKYHLQIEKQSKFARANALAQEDSVWQI